MYWKVKKGKIVGLMMPGHEEMSLNPPIDLSQLNQNLSLVDLDTYLSMHLKIIGMAAGMPVSASMGPQEAPKAPVEPERLGPGDYVVWTEGNGDNRRFQRRAVQIVHNVLEAKKTIARKDVVDNPNWRWGDGHAGHLLRALLQKGTIVRHGNMGGSTYEYVRNYPGNLYDFIRKKGRTTPEMVAEEYWVGEQRAKEWLNNITGKEVVKHVRKDEWFPASNVPEDARAS